LFDSVELAIGFVNAYNKDEDNFEWDWWHIVNALSLEVVTSHMEYEE
jgi:hypothetical protein